MTLPSIKAVGIARRVGRRRRAKQRLMPTAVDRFFTGQQSGLLVLE
jgi:hypothetical protein